MAKTSAKIMPPSWGEAEALLGLTLVPRVGATRIRALLSRFGSAEAIWEVPAQHLAGVDGIGPQTASAIHAFNPVPGVEDAQRRASDVGARLCTLMDRDYPSLLRETFDAPVVLWYRGFLSALAGPSIAMVGTRKPSDYGRRVAHALAADLAQRGIAVVSGLAYGIDAAAHAGALDAGGTTVAVMGTGIDRLYPHAHRSLAERIEQQGALVTEYLPGTAPDAVNFPRRNRIISGMTRGTVVVEAFEKGGALITARMAVEQNREVFAVPGTIYNPAGVGCNRLIQAGHAKLVQSVDDILEEVGFNLDASAPSTTAPAPAIEQLNALERRLYEAIGAEPVHIDAVCRKAEVDPSTALVYLLSLEFKGLVRQMAGKQFYRS